MDNIHGRLLNFLQFTEERRYLEQFSLNMEDAYHENGCSLWQHTKGSVKGISLEKKTTVHVCGDRVVEYHNNFVVPDTGSWTSISNSIFQVFFLGLLPIILAFISSAFLALGVGIYLLVRKLKKRPLPLEWHKTFMFGWTFFILLLIKEISDRVGILYYNHTVFGFEMSVGEMTRVWKSAFESTLFGGVISLVLPPIILLVIGRYLSMRYFPSSLKTFDMFFSGHWGDENLFLATMRGIKFFIALLAIESLSIFIGALFLNSWSDVRNPLGIITSPLHLLSSDFTYSGLLLPAFDEEITFRLLLISFFFIRYKKLFVAVLFTAIFWSMLHVTLIYHPFYIQQINLTLSGVILGWVFIRYGLWEAIVAHFLFNAVILLIPVFAIATLQESILLAFITASPVLLLVFVYFMLKKSL